MSQGNGNGQYNTARPANLPRHWDWVKVQDAGSVRLGRQRSPKNRSSKYPTKYVRAANITWAGLDLSDLLDMDFRPDEVETYALHAGDVVLSEASGSAGEVGKPAIWIGGVDNCCFQNTVIRFRPQAVTSRFAHAIFSHYARNGVFARVAKGLGIHHLGADRFGDMGMPVPPTDEQDRIVAKIEELFSDLDAGVAALKRVQANLKRYRAAALKAAVEGRLTADWRAQHPNAEPASVLLDRILTERRSKWEADQLARFEAAGKKPPKGWKDKYVEPAAPDTASLPDLPKGWCWATVTQLAMVQGGIQKQPSRAPRDNAYPYLRVANVLRNKLDLTQMERFELSAGELERLRLEPGDLLIVEGNGSRTEIGRSAIWNGEIADCVHQNHVIRVRAIEVRPKYLNAYWNSPQGQHRVMAQAASTSGLYTLSVTKVAALPVPVPPIEEQVGIIAEVERRLSMVDEAERLLVAGALRSSRLRQSVLKRAFEGTLVPQEAADGSARVESSTALGANDSLAGSNRGSTRVQRRAHA